MSSRDNTSGSGGRARQSHSYSRSASITGNLPTTTETPFGDDSQVNLNYHRPSQGRGSTSGFSSAEDDISPRTTSTAASGDRFEASVPIPSSSPFDDMSNQAAAEGSSSGSGSGIFNDNYSPAQPSSPVMPASASPPHQAGEYSPTQEFTSYPTGPTRDLNHLYAPRPQFGRATSDEPLLHDISGANTPADVGANPFDTVDPSAHTSRASSPDLEAIGPNAIAPKIHINSIPNSPDPSHVASFDPRPSFAAPFSDQPRGSQQVITKKVSIAENPISSRYSDNSSSSGGFGGAAAAGGLTSIAQRRSQRMQTQQERLSGIKGSKGQHDGKGGKGAATNRKPFQSTRLKGEIYKPWLEKKDPAQRWARWITIVSIIIGIGAAAARKSSLPSHEMARIC